MTVLTRSGRRESSRAVRAIAADTPTCKTRSSRNQCACPGNLHINCSPPLERFKAVDEVRGKSSFPDVAITGGIGGMTFSPVYRDCANARSFRARCQYAVIGQNLRSRDVISDGLGLIAPSGIHALTFVVFRSIPKSAAKLASTFGA